MSERLRDADYVAERLGVPRSWIYSAARRGALPSVRCGRDGRQWWYGRWHNGASRPNRRIGAIRTRGGEEGLTRREAERALQKLIESEQPKDAGTEITVGEAAFFCSSTSRPRA